MDNTSEVTLLWLRLSRRKLNFRRNAKAGVFLRCISEHSTSNADSIARWQFNNNF